MANEGFFQRWSRLKHEGEAAPPPVPAAPDALPAETPAAPTMDDAACLGADADYSRFVAPEVDSGVRRLALRKLFADPHFNRIDGLDIYMGDYSRSDPVTPAMLASLGHAQDLLARALGLDGAARPSEAPPPDQDKP